jgi:hypothetical protein
LLSFGVSDEIVETGIPVSRRYDPLAELARIRGVLARQANARPRPSITYNSHRSLRRG